MLGIGIDILSITRFEGLLARRGAQALARRICSKREYDEFRSVPADQHVKYLSSRWCLKEAAYKSLSSHSHPRWTGFDIHTSSYSAPTIRFTDRLLLRSGATLRREEVEMMASLSNDAGVVVGVVIAMRKG
ncbi:4'-phosphopantetheinyl transferase superfamily [Dioszegia hungarica]|uniref:4'-phosphopantetheinyl transferase superfamily n=1 Tax=Dioszegia hungarica TaxID=4972 RepID=A0AA38LW68_9TREE|nr:4'-phosphopantetheinyl transferase superfamily [Dioszegia hungarica]KAI9638070.1 4'-phosphopantetheinyl transferase superfamily [Dioszegia hungarica]